MSGSLNYNAVVIGGGTGTQASIRACLQASFNTTAVVAMADDGGSSGMLRMHGTKSQPCLPPGDIRNCLTAMAASEQDPWVMTFRQRLKHLHNHSLGNLIIQSLCEQTGSFVEAIALCEQLLGCKGKVLPSTLCDINLRGFTRDGRVIEGQSAICASGTALQSVELFSGDYQAKEASQRCTSQHNTSQHNSFAHNTHENNAFRDDDFGRTLTQNSVAQNSCKPITAYRPALDAIKSADIIVLGPGSLFTSIIATLQVPGILDAINNSKAVCAYIAPLTDSQGETWGLSLPELVQALKESGLSKHRLDVLIAHDKRVPCRSGNVTAAFKAVVSRENQVSLDSKLTKKIDSANGNTHVMTISDNDMLRLQTLVPKVFVRRLIKENDSADQPRHDVLALARLLLEVAKDCRLQPR
ncbi:MAG: YvcK family protein [Coriobacteriales bacterium]|jgi:2-phospho-L-lactate transferase/gluconeogenesis factor (CofD/UPF0052 family)|nr:YvcK family protein [Coriobacteriales bacterium]